MPVTFQSTTLANGLTIIAETDPDAHTAACGFFVRTGARDEATPLMGVSHFLEHMMFKGTPKRSAEDVNLDFDRIGAVYNAFTSSEMTVFYGSVLSERLAGLNDILADIMRPSLRQSDFDAEKSVILEEIAMYRDQPFWVLYERVLEEYYADHPLAHRVLGTNDTIKALTRDQMQGYFDSRYSADNTTIALAGNLDFSTTVKQLDQLCGGWRNTGAARASAQPTPRTRTLDLTDERITRAYLLMITPGPAAEDESRYAAAMLAKILGDAGNSRLHWALIETGIAEEAMAAYDTRDGCGDFYVYASGSPERADEIWAIAEREIDGVIASLTEDDLDRLRNKSATTATLAGERPGGRMQRLGRNWLYLGRRITLEEELAKLNAVTMDDIREVWKRYPFEPRTFGRMMPKT